MNNKGMTLLESLAAVTIMSMVVYWSVPVIKLAVAQRIKLQETIDSIPLPTPSPPPTTTPLNICIEGIECDPLLCIKDKSNNKNIVACYESDCVWDTIDKTYSHDGELCIQVLSS